MRDVELPVYYDDLAASLDVAWDLLERGARDRRMMAHTPTVATVDEAGKPALRTVVLRACEKGSRALSFNTDERSAKLAHMRRHPIAAMHVYEPLEKIQLRLHCDITVHKNDDFARDRWARSAPSSRICYQVSESPGTRIDDPRQPTADSEASDGGAANFVAVRAVVASLEWLYLSAAGHRRAVYTWDGNDLDSRWLVP